MGRDPTSASGKSLAAYRAIIVRLVLAAAILSAGLFAVVRSYPGRGIPAAMGRNGDGAANAPAVGLSSESRMQDLVLGTWEDDYQGKRTLTVRPNGTATMVVEFDGWKARMFTPRLRIETTWTIDEGRFNRRTVGGEPADKVEFVKRRVGDRASDQIVKVTAQRMVLIDQDGETRYNWRRVR
ncbi:MAG: hypothetical protein WD894_08830 [Pirellulales bacterium]